MTRVAFVLSFLVATALDSIEAGIFSLELKRAAEEAIQHSHKLHVEDRLRRRNFDEKLRLMSQPKARALNNYDSDDEQNSGQNDDQFQDNQSDYEWNEQMAEQDFGFEITEYALKYTGCQTVESYDDAIAADEEIDGVLKARRFATFRLCPTQDCSSNNHIGCSSNYGEYVVSMDQFLGGLISTEEDRVRGFCMYCQECASIQSFKAFVSEITALKSASVQAAGTFYAQWAANYQEANGYNDNYDDDTMAAMYWQVLNSNNGNYANNYRNGNYVNSQAYSDSSSNGSGSSNRWWQNNANAQVWSSSSNQQHSQQGSWDSMGNWYGRPLLNGYFEDGGTFYAGWGYVSQYNGSFVLLDENQPVYYDVSLFGDLPEGWDESWFQNPDEVESCAYSSSKSCSNQYTSCMEILEDENYISYMKDTYGSSYEQQREQGRASEFLQCTAVDAQYSAYGTNGQFYIGPHCDSNGRSIELGVFTDQYCSNHSSDIPVTDLLGYDPLEDNANLFPDECIPCADNSTSIQQWYEADYGEAGVAQVCSTLYQLSGKCNKNLSPTQVYGQIVYSNQTSQRGVNCTGDEESCDEYDQMYQSQQQGENEAKVCSFIASLTSGTYDRNGQVSGTGSNWPKQWSSPSNWRREFEIEKKAMGTGQKVTLAFGALAVVAMAAYAIFLRETLSRRKTPLCCKKGEEEMDITRQNSGIVMGRSQSAPSSIPLI